jgi:hypothetical protein
MESNKESSSEKGANNGMSQGQEKGQFDFNKSLDELVNEDTHMGKRAPTTAFVGQKKEWPGRQPSQGQQNQPQQQPAFPPQKNYQRAQEAPYE